MSRIVKVYPNSHGPWCKCERCSPPPTAGQTALAVGVLGLIALVTWVTTRDR